VWIKKNIKKKKKDEYHSPICGIEDQDAEPIVAMSCLSMASFQNYICHHFKIIYVIITASGDQDAEPGARLTCHILLKLFKTSDSALTMYSQSCYSRSSSNIKASCDRHLLAAAHDSITVGPVLAVLKAMLMLSK